MNGEKLTLYNEKLVFKNSVKIFTLRVDVLKMIDDFKFNTTDSPDAKKTIDVKDKIRFDMYSGNKNLRITYLLKKFSIKEFWLNVG